MKRLRRAMLIFVVPLLLAIPPTVSASPAEQLAATTFNKVANPCAEGETWIKPDRIVQHPNGGTINEYDKAGAVVRTPQPPATFDPLAASAAKLAAYGLPDRPTSPADLEAWRENMAAWRPTKDLGECQTDLRAAIVDSLNWAGYGANRQGNTSYYRAIQGDYHQPAKLATSCSPSQEVSWVGLGGHYTSRLLQTGTGIATDGSKYAWYEYLSATGGIPVTKLPSVTVNAGDRIHLYLVHQTSGSGQTTFYVADNTTGTSQSKILNLGSAYYDGSTAEFIDERPSVWNGFTYVPTNLTNFDEVNWTNTKVFKYDGTWHTLGSEPRNTYNMWNNSFSHYLAWPSTMSSNTTFKDNWIACN